MLVNLLILFKWTLLKRSLRSLLKSLVIKSLIDNIFVERLGFRWSRHQSPFKKHFILDVHLHNMLNEPKVPYPSVRGAKIDLHNEWVSRVESRRGPLSCSHCIQAPQSSLYKKAQSSLLPLKKSFILSTFGFFLKTNFLGSELRRNLL